MPTADTIKLEDMREAWNTFQNGLHAGKEYIADHNAAQIENLNRNVQELNDAVLNIIDTVKSGVFVAAPPESGAAAAMASDLETILAQVAGHQNDSSTYKDYQVLFNLPEFDFSNVLMAEKEANNRYQIWKTLADFEARERDWTKGALLTETGEPRLSVEEVRLSVDTFSSTAYKMAKVRIACLLAMLCSLPCSRPGAPI